MMMSTCTSACTPQFHNNNKATRNILEFSKVINVAMMTTFNVAFYSVLYTDNTYTTQNSIANHKLATNYYIWYMNECLLKVKVCKT